ncbi:MULTISPECIES: hemerythrin family protein [unclassified Herbaspirillum]|uniref:bacteriohemerythrin n=1 Tax=unclassified Herbaspirillum TaxID=2624150 RepID=UPI000E2E7112|nr:MULTISPECIES: hemerythrin family protein [unclassified Herbaspirillum]RFB69558.1 hypothetical protein DZB54_12835 [Herbaspirillum sp. 3R-3a1]TFI07385.1 hypothetical protein E4P32_15955 [Herbaspirillum sp. 3R11]TFI12160.1 hypothetical protein E4P31_22985 [Herbaspirillum sp. 3R-11]TFI21796.1 hypothetical protein E4P30_20165 [Herbaspirillum sp. 3C11]
MENLEWSPQMSLGITEMDDAHRALVRELTLVMQAPDHEFSARLQGLIGLLEADFREEEALMEEISYANANFHRQHHAQLLSTLHHLVPRALSGDYVLPRGIVHALPQWFLVHLVRMDAPLVNALAAHALQAEQTGKVH